MVFALPFLGTSSKMGIYDAAITVLKTLSSTRSDNRDTCTTKKDNSAMCVNSAATATAVRSGCRKNHIVLWYKSFHDYLCHFEAASVFTPEELRQANIFACLDEAECARLAQTIADVRLEPGEWVFREGAPAWFYVLLEGRPADSSRCSRKADRVSGVRIQTGRFPG
jgi:hypothetical protein